MLPPSLGGMVLGIPNCFIKINRELLSSLWWNFISFKNQCQEKKFFRLFSSPKIRQNPVMKSRIAWPPRRQQGKKNPNQAAGNETEKRRRKANFQSYNRV